MKKKYLLLLILMLILPMVSAVPPFETEFIGDVGLDIEANVNDYYKINEGACVHIFVFNKSNGVIMDNTTVSCRVELTNHNGTVVFEGNPTGHRDHFQVCRDATIVTTVEVYGLTIVCNNSKIGSYKTHYFEANVKGKAVPEGISFVLTGLFLLIFGVSGFFLILFMKIESPPIKLFFFLLSFIFLIGSLLVAMVVGLNSGLPSEITSTMNYMFYALGLVFTLIFIFVMLKQITNTLDMMREKKGHEVGFD